jgi:toxin CcdB
MAQFDVHRNIARNRSLIPYLLVVQSQRWSRAPTRLVMPLNPLVPGSSRDSDLTPIMTVAGDMVVLNPLMMFAIELARLGPVVASLADDTSAARIIASLDEAIARGYR